MRVPPPGILKVDRALLLADVRERLAESLPAYANREDDPTDPGWLLLEQAAWMVEILSEQLDAYPFAAVQHFVHMMGGQLRPAQPSVGLVLAEVATEGELTLDEKRPSPWRFFTPQDEDMESIEFVPAESGVELRKGRFLSMCEVSADELFHVGPTESAEGTEGLAMWRGERRRSQVFKREQVFFDCVTNNTEALIEALENALGMLEERRIGWLDLEIRPLSKERVRLVARIDPAGAFARVAPGGIWMGGDLEGDWGTLDASTWTPVVTITHHPMLPPHLHGQFPLPGYEEGQILLTDIPENFPVAELLERKASPMPETVVESLWQTLVNLDSRLAPIKPAIQVSFPGEPSGDDLEPDWVAGALESGVWSDLTIGQPNTVFHLHLEGKRKKPARVRVAVVHEEPEGTTLPEPRAYGLKANGELDRTPVTLTEVWRLPTPPREGSHVMPVAVAYDVTIQPDAESLLLVSGGQPVAGMLNTLLVANAPAVSDGRSVVIDRNVPTEISLLYENVVDAPVMAQLLEEPIPSSAARTLSELPLSYFAVADKEPVRDFGGVRIDASEGTLTLNAPDREGEYRVFRPGTRMRLEWYRRTDGAAGNKGPEAIRLVAQPPTVVPKVVDVINPLGTFFGAERESPEDAIDRMFGPSQGTPVMASDYERLVRQALGSRGRGWYVRCWTYAERALVSTSFWPFPGASNDADPEVGRTAAALDGAGPDTLLVVLGPTDHWIPDEDLDWARRAVQRMIKRLARRIPTVRDAVVTRFWGLTMEVASEAEEAEVLVPTFEVGAMSGPLRDTAERRLGPAPDRAGDFELVAEEPALRPKAVLCLNAAVTHVRVTDQEYLG